jgi:hypothetical protein
MQLLLDAQSEKVFSNQVDDESDLTNISIQKNLSIDVN